MSNQCPYCKNPVVATNDAAYVNGIRATGPQSCEFCKPTTRICAACGKRPADTDPDDGWTPLCEECSERAGEPVKPGDRVVNRVDDGCSGMVVRIVDENMVVVRTNRGDPEAWLPIGDLVRVE